MASRLPPDGLDPISTTLPDGYYIVQKTGTRFRAWTQTVPVLLLPAGSTAASVPVGTPVGTIILVKA